MVHIFQVDEDPALRSIAKPILIGDIGSARIQKIIGVMKKAMHSQDDAVAIAAPQVGVPLRIFIVSGKVFMEPEEMQEEMGDKKPAAKTKDIPPDLVCINPELKKLSRKKEQMEEGCLSVRWLYGKVKRSEKATLRAHDEHGRLFTRGASGLLAQVFQHENDHLDGIIFTDKATDIREVPPTDEK